MSVCIGCREWNRMLFRGFIKKYLLVLEFFLRHICRWRAVRLRSSWISVRWSTTWDFADSNYWWHKGVTIWVMFWWFGRSLTEHLGNVSTVVSGDEISELRRGDVSPGGCRFPWFRFLSTRLNIIDTDRVQNAYTPSPPGHFLPASKENTSSSQPYFLKNFSGHVHCFRLLLSV